MPKVSPQVAQAAREVMALQSQSHRFSFDDFQGILRTALERAGVSFGPYPTIMDIAKNYNLADDLTREWAAQRLTYAEVLKM